MRVRTSAAASGMKPLEPGIRIGIRNGRCIVSSLDVVFLSLPCLHGGARHRSLCCLCVNWEGTSRLLNFEWAPVGLRRDGRGWRSAKAMVRLSACRARAHPSRKSGQPDGRILQLEWAGRIDYPSTTALSSPNLTTGAQGEHEGFEIARG